MRPLPKSLRYNVESLEPRYLLSGVALTNSTNNGSKPVDSTYVTAVSNAVQAVIGVKPVIGNLSYLGQQIDKTSISNATATNKIPLLNQTPNQLASLATTGSSFGTQAGNITFGSLLLNETDSGGNNLFTQDLATFLSTTSNANNLTSSTLAAELQTEGQTLFGNGFTVADKSLVKDPTGKTLDLQVSFAADTFHSVPIDIGASASEYNILLGSEATGAPNVQLETKLSATFDITADLTSFNSGYSGSNNATTEDNAFNVVTTPTSFQQSAQVANAPLPTFGIEFGVVGAGNPGIIENGATLNNSTTMGLGSVSDLSIGMSVQGTGLSVGTTITGINTSNNTVTLSNAATINATEQVTVGAVNGAYVNASAFVEGSVTITSGSGTLNLGSVTGMAAGMSVQGAGIPLGTTIASVDTVNNAINLSASATASSVGTVTVNATAALVLNEQTVLQLTSPTLNYANLGAATYQFSAPVAPIIVDSSVTVTSGSKIVNLTSVSGLVAGMSVEGAGIVSGTTIASIDTVNKRVTLSLAATSTNTGTVTFGVTATTIGTAAAPNTAEFNTGVIGIEDISTLPGYVGNLNPTGYFIFYSNNLFDGHPALVFPGSSELANLARVSNADIVVDAQNADTLINALGNNSALQSNVPFTSETLSNAYDFGTAAEIGFVNALQSTSVVLTGTSSPGTYDSTTQTFDNTDLSGASTFVLEVVLSSGVISTYTISIPSGGSNRTLQGLAADFQNALKSAHNQATNTNQDLTGSFTAQVSGSTLQLVSKVSGIQFFLSNFSSDAASPANGTLNLGFNSYGTVAAYANGDLNTTANYQIPGVVLTSSSAVQVTDFNTETRFGIQVNNGTSSVYGPGYVTVSLAAGSYSSTTLVQALTTALQQAQPGLNSGFDTNGVMVRSIALSGGGFGLQFYGGDDVYQLAIQDIATPGSISSISKFQLSTTTVTAPYFNLSINGQTATRVYLNGNFTSGLLDNLAPASSLNDLIHDLQLALISSGALSADQSSGITVSSTATSTGNELVFAAVNPGTGTGQISKFSITGQSRLTSLNLLGGGSNNSLHWASGQSKTQPAFVTIQDLEILLLQKGVMHAGTFGDYDSTNGTFTFPLNFTVNSSSSSTDFPNLSVPLSFATTYGSVSNLQSSSTVGLSRSDNLQFNFGFNVTPQTGAGEILYADLPMVIPLWDVAANQSLQSSSPLLFQISTDDGVVHTLQLNQVVQNNGTSKFYYSTDSSTTATDFISALNTALTKSGLQVTAQFSSEDNLGRAQIVFSTTAGAYRELVVTVPATSSGVTSVSDSAWSNLGFGTGHTGPSYTAASNANNQITGAGAIQFVLSGTNNTIPTNGNFYVTLPDGTNSGFTLNPANLPSNASTTDVINELNYEIAATTNLLGSSYGALGAPTLKMSLTSGSTTATLDASSTIDPTPYLDASNNVGAGYGLIPGTTLTGTGLAAGTIIQSVTYDPTTQTVKLGLSQAATSSTTNGAITVQASAAAAQYNILPKLIASAQVSGSTTKIVLSLNPKVFGPGQQSWSLQVSSTYLQQLDNPASLELGLPASTVTDSAVPATGIVSTAITANTFTNWTTANAPASFQVSVNGSSYVTVTINKGTINSLAGLITALNTALTNTTIDLSVPGAAETTTYHLNQFFHAEATNGGTSVLIRLVNGSTPAVSGARIAVTSGANVMNNAGVLGFFSPTGPTEYVFGQRGAEAVVNSPVLSGTLTISNATFTGTAQFGFVNFDVGNGILNETVNLIFSSTNSSSTLLDLQQSVSDAGDSTSDLYKSYSITVQPTTQADVLLESLSFPNATSISNLSFGPGAVIEILYPLSTAQGATGHYITDFSNLPPPEVTYTNTNGMELLTRLSFSGIADGLMRVGDMITDWMKTNLNDPFSSSLLYSKLSMLQIDNIGADFKALIQQIELQPPGSLQTAAQVLANGLQLPLGGIQFSIANTTTEDVNGHLGNGGQLALQISFDWVKSLTQTLPLSVDLATMYDKASANNGTGQTPQIDLLGLSSISGSGVNALNVILTEVSRLEVNMSLVVAQATSSSVLPVAIQPEAIISQPPAGNFFETRFFLEADGLSGELPAGVDYLQLTNGSVAIDATGQTDIPYASQSSTGTLILTSNTGANTSGMLTGTVAYDTAPTPDRGILIQGVTTMPFNVPVVSGVITGSGLFTLDGITPAVGSQILVNSADNYTMLANASYSSTNPAQNYVLTGIATSVFAQLSVGQGISGSFLPAGTVITAIDATNHQITLSQAISGTGSQTQGVFFIQQNATTANGLYTVTQNNSTSGYILTQVETIASYNTLTPDQRFVVTSASANTIANQVYSVSTATHFGAVTTAPNNLDANGTPFTYDLTAASSFTDPAVVNVLAVSGASSQSFNTSSQSALTSLWTLGGNGNSLVIDGFTLNTAGQVILNHQTNTSQDGLYNLTFGSGKWTLKQVSTPANLSPTTRYSILHGTVFGGTQMGTIAPTQFGVMLQPVLAASTASMALSGTGNSVTIDGFALTTAGYVILNHQSNSSLNGLYTLAFSGGNWSLTLVSTPIALSIATRFQILHGTTYGGTLMAAYGGTQFAVMLQPASYSYNLQSINSSTSEILPYTVSAATDASLSSLATYSNGVFTSNSKINLNAQIFTESDSSVVTGIDGVSNLTVGSLVLVKDETGANAYENGVYELTSVGQSGVSAWTLQRADFAVTQGQMVNIRIAVDQGHTNANTRWVQTATDLATTPSTVNSAITSGDSVTFSNALGLVYKNGTSTWLTTSINGGSQANLPLQLVQVNNDGTQTLINRDLGSLTVDAKKALGGDGGSLITDPLYLYYQSLVGSNYVIQPTPVFTSLNIVIPNLNNFYTSPSVGTLFFNPAPGYNPSNANTQNNPPALVNSATSANVLTQLQNGFYLGDALDLALFSIQSAMDQAMGIEFPLVGTNLNLYTSYVEQIRRTLTSNIRSLVLANPLTPVDDVRDALFATLGNNPGGLGYLTDESQITVNLYSGGSTPTTFDFNRADLVNYVQTPLGLKNTVSGTVTSITFGIKLTGVKNGAGYHDDKINQVTLGDSAIGEVISTNTVSSTGAATTGGVDLQTYFNFNFGFGVSTSTGFFIFNPTSADTTPKPMIDLNFTAQLTGDISASGVTPFVQTDFSSTLQNLQVNVADGRAKTDTVAAGGDGYASGFFGDVLFNLDNHITGGSDPLARNSTHGQDLYATVDDLREAQELGPNVTTASKKPSALLNFTINADADIDLLIQSKQAGLIPAIQTDLVLAKRYGTGASASFNLNFSNTALVGLGNQTLGQTVLNDYTNYYDGTQANNNSAAYNTLTQAEKDQVDSDYQNGSPIWRFERGNLISNGQSGNTFIAYQNLEVDVYDYLTGPFFKSLINLENAIAPLRPVLNFITTPLPGTSWMPTPLILINLFPSNLSPKSTSPSGKSNGTGAEVGSALAKIQLLIEILHSIDNMLGPLASLAATASATAPWQHPQASLGGQASWSNKPLQLNGLTDQTNAQNLKLYKDAASEASTSRQNLSNLAELPFYEGPGNAESVAQQNQNSISKALSSLNENLTTPNKYSETFNSLQNGEFFDTTSGNALTKIAKGGLNDKAVENDKRGGQYSISVGLSGGAFYLDAFSPTSILEILNGQNANLLQVQLPTISITFGYMKTFPLPAFPPLQLRLGISFTVAISVNLGYDTNGFYWNTVDLTTHQPAPLFSFAVQFSVGVGLDFGFVSVSIDLFFRLTVGFIWNDVSGTGVLHQTDIDYLQSQHQSLFAVELKGQIGFHFEIDLTIPLLFTTITIPIYSYDYSITVFDFLLGSYTGHIQLGSVANGVLQLNMGPYAGSRNYVNTSNRNETFYVYGYNQGASAGSIQSSGETVVVEFDSGSTTYYQEFTGVKQVVGYAGVGDSAIYAGTSLTLSSAIDLVGGGTVAANTVLTALDYAVVDFYGGAGNVVLQAGASYYSGWATTSGRSRLVGGTGTSFLDGSDSNKSLDLIAGSTTSTLQGSTAGGDNIVARQGSDLLYGNGPGDIFSFTNGFGHDRIYATGNGNSVNFSGVTLSASATDPGQVPALVISPVTTSIDFQFGQLVDSAVTGNSTVFFAVDPSEKNSIDTWTGGTGGDIFTAFFFAPNQTLNLNETINSGANKYDIFLGDPNIHYYVPGDSRNIGTINIHDNSTTQGQVFLTQLFSNTITYNNTMVSNGREQMTFSPALQVSLNAPDATLYWGDPNNPSAYTVQAGGNISVGHLVLLGNVLLTSNAIIHLSHSFLLNYDIDVKGGTLTNPASIEFDLHTDNPAVDANFVLANNSTTNQPSRLMISTGTTQDGLGIGNIFLNLYTGSLLNQSGTTNYGVIELGTGTLVILALETIGTLTSPINVKVDNLTAKTTTTLNPLFTFGIYIYSSQDLKATGYGSVSGNHDDNILGVTTVNGDIWLEVAPTFTLTYYQIIAGGSGNITIIADHISITAGFNVIENQLQAVPHTYTYSYIFYYPEYIYFSVNYLFFTLTYPVLIYLPVYFTYSYTYFTYDVLPTAVTIQPSGAKIQGSGNLQLENATSAANIQVGGSALLPSATGLLISDAVLGSVVTGFATLTIGRNKPSTGGASTGTVTLAHQENFTQASSILLQGTNLVIDYSVSATNLLTFNAYNVAAGSSINFTTSGNTYQAATLVVSTDQTADLSLHGLFLSTAAGGAVQISTQGNLNLFGSIAANNGNASKIVVQAAGSITIDNKDQIQNSSNVFYNSLSAYNGTGDTASEIDLTAGQSGAIGIAQSTTDLHSAVIAPNMSLAALGSIVLTTQMDTLLLASGSSVNLTNKNLAASLWTINKVSASTGAVSITDAASGIQLARTTTYALDNLISTAQNQSVSITSGGGFTGNSTGSTLDISTTNLTMRTAGGITGATSTSNLLIHAAQLDAVTSALGDVRISNVNSPITLTQLVTDNGLISFQSNDDITVDKVQSQTSSASNSITLTTTLGQGGNINLGNVVGSITGVVDAGALGAVTLSADGLIAGALAAVNAGDITQQLDLITGTSVSLTSNANPGAANNAILAAVKTGYLDAVTNNSGQIQIYAQSPAATGSETSENLFLHNVSSAQGNVTILGASTGLPLNFVTGDVNARASDLTLKTSGTITENTSGPTATDLLDLLVFQLHAGLLTTLSTGTSYLDTAVVSLDAAVLGTGSLTVLARGTLDIYSATTQNGAIIINGAAASPASIRVGTIDAGKTGGSGTKSDVTITSNILDILDLNAAHNNVTPQLFSSYVTLFGPLTGLTAARFTANTGFGIQGLTTQVDTLDATSTQNLSAEMILTQTGDITIDNVSMVAGSFALTANANITVNSLTSDQTGSLITLITTGGWIRQSAGTPATTANIIGYALNLQAVNGILLNTGISILTATNSGGTDTSRANIVLNNLFTTELDVSQVAASHGNIDLTTAGDLVLKNLPSGQSDYFSTPTNGASSVTPYHISVTSGGVITGGTAGNGATSFFDFVTDDLTLTGAGSQSGLGNNNTLVTQLSKLTATTSAAGPIRVTNRGAVELINVETANGPIFVQDDSDMIVDTVKTDTISTANSITLISTGGVIDQNAATPATTPNVIGDILNLQAINGILLNTDISVLTATNSGGTDTSRANIVLNNLSTTELDVSQVAASHGNIDLTTAGDLVLKNLPLGQSDYFSTPTNGASSATPYHINVTTGGTITGGTTGTGATSLFDFVTDDLTLTGVTSLDGLGGNNSLVTQISKLTATTSGAGEISVTNRGALELVNVETANGPIFVQNDAAMIVDTVKSDTSAPANTITLQNTLGLTAGNITLGTIDAGALADVTVTSTGAILGGTGNLITGKTLTLTAQGFEGNTQAAIDVNVLGSVLIANATGSGQILIHTAGDLTLDQVDTASGDIHITATGLASLLTSEIEAGTAIAFASDIYLTAAGTIGEYKPATPNPLRTYKIVGNLLTTQAGGTTYLDTIVQTLDATVTGPGTLTVDQTGNLNVYNAVTANGVITITTIPTTGQTGANIFIGTLTAGASVTGESDVNLTANGGYIQDLDVTTITDPAVVPPVDYAPLLSGATLTVLADQGIHGLHTAVTTFDATTTAANAYIVVTEKDDIKIDHVLMPYGDFTLTAGGEIVVNDIRANTGNATVNLTSVGSDIVQPSGKINAYRLNAKALTGIQALTNIDDLTATITGIAGDINIREDSSITLEQVYTPSGTFTLNAGVLSGGSVAGSLLTDPLGTPPTYHVVANNIIINTTAGIGTLPEYLAVYADDIVQATASLTGGIYIHNYKIHSSPATFELTKVLSNTGPIDIISAGDMFAKDVEIHLDQPGNDINLTTTNGGNMLLNFVGTGLVDAVIGVTPPTYGIATFTSAGNIEAVDPGSMLHPVNIVANGINFDAQTGIGSGSSGPTMTGKFLSAQTVTGDIISGNSTASDFFISRFTTGSGNLGFTQSGGGALHATDLVTLHGNIALDVKNGAYLFLGTTYSIGNTTLVSDHITFQGGTGSIFGTGVLIIHPDNPHQYVQVNSFFAGTIYERSDTLEISKISYEAFLTDFQTIFIGNQSSSQLTYMYYDVMPGDGPYLGLLSGNYNLFEQGQPSAPVTDYDAFRLSDLYLTPAETAILQGANLAEMEQILETTLNIDDQSGANELFDDDMGANDDFFAVSEPISASTPSVTSGFHATSHEHDHMIATMENASGNDAWIDRALVITAMTAPLAVATQPRNWFRKLSEAWSRRK